MKPTHKYESKVKEFRKLLKKLLLLRKAKRELGWTYLKKPIRHGFYKELVFREDILKRKEVPVYLEILEATKVVKWGSSKKRLEKAWGEQSKNNKRIQYPGISALPQKEYDKLSDKAKRFFIKRQREMYTPGYFETLYISILPAFYFNFKVSRAYIYKRKIIDSELESEMKLIENKMETEFYVQFYGRFSNSPKWWRKLERTREKRKVQRVLKQHLFGEKSNEEKIYEGYKTSRC